MVCLETSFVIDVLRGEEVARDTLDAIESEGVRPTVTPVGAAEVWVGAQLGSTAEREATASLLESLTWLSFTRQAAELAGDIRASLTENGEVIGITDAMIAGLAIDHDEVLVTRDWHFERIPDLRTRIY